ncbi:protein translocase subunit yidC [Geothermobacter ehrlichii]|uniref:Membrane protein insertase YidC n=1 Tax=Geothermobacter ehrlichii TaxID=213224 RepID=A0A5D3WKJ2_9BACT|nr:membrane protein insertase YidC [Geothermobacter ehrlichii]TYO97665.1 protein translocase subunit yidC [Geothermobacter ehrlichii]
MENRNTIIALVLMAVVWFGYNLLFPPAPVPSEKSAAPAVEQKAAAEHLDTAPASVPAPVLPPAAKSAAGMSADYVERTLTVENSLYRAKLTTSGGRLVSFSLKQYRQQAEPDSEPVVLHAAGDKTGLSLVTSGGESINLPADAPFQLLEGDGPIVLESGEQKQVVFRYVDAGSGLTVDKVFTFRGDEYLIDLEIRIANPGRQQLQGTLTLGLVHPWDESQNVSRYGFVGPATLVGEGLETDSVKSLKKESKTYSKPVWSGFETKYFITACVPLEKAADKVVLLYRNDSVVNNFVSPYLQLPPGQSLGLGYRLYFGPLDFEILKAAGHRLDKAIDLGFFTPIAAPLRVVLHFFHSYTGNWGLAIILLTVIIKLIFWPLTHKSYKSMREMQKIQPEMQKIREKFRHDRERMNKEMMSLYKEKRVNPMGGCLPMLVQIPVFFALYKVLMVDIALRHAPFIFWLNDLSAKDPYYITPIIMGVTMFIQQKMTPSSMDPTQAKVFMAMPIVFTFLFLNFPSGLVIYWLVNNILTIGQQYMIRRQYS